MSDTSKREAVLEEFAHDAGVHRVWGVAGMADKIVRLRDENAALRAAVERVLALHEVFGDWCDRCNCVAPCATIRALEGTP